MSNESHRHAFGTTSIEREPHTDMHLERQASAPVLQSGSTSVERDDRHRARATITHLERGKCSCAPAPTSSHKFQWVPDTLFGIHASISLYIHICTYANSYTFCSRPARTKIQSCVATPSVRSKFHHDLVPFLLIVLLESIVDLMEVRLAHHPDDVAVIVIFF